ncbi:MAG: methylmalonyl Co-A mutase-associated GTPase MeaB [Acidobacteriota bacterium]
MPSAEGRQAAEESTSLAASLVEQLRAGERRALARSISMVEDRAPASEAIIKGAFGAASIPPVIGVTGPSGSGKSTLVDALTVLYRQQGSSVGVLAIDPSSPFTGGAMLGDRVRMQRHGEDAGVFVRSMATRGTLGGLAAAVYDTLVLLAAAGLERLLVETVGVGQDEVDIAGVADTTCVVLTPGSGDEIQAIKAGIMEIADLFVLNKADVKGADRAEAQLRAWVARAPAGGWTPPILRTVALEGEGIVQLQDAIAAHQSWYSSSGRGTCKRRALAALRLQSLLRERLMRMAQEKGLDQAREAELVEAMVEGKLDPYSAADEAMAFVNARGKG